MRELDLYRKVFRETAQRSAGRYPGERLVTTADIANAGAEHDVLLLWEDTSNVGAIQSASGGGVGFMVGRSAIDGPSPIL